MILIALMCTSSCSAPEVDAADAEVPDTPADIRTPRDTRSPRDARLDTSPGWQGPHFVEVVRGAAHACARTDTGQVYCWGSDEHLQLGQGLVHRGGCDGGDVPCRPFAALAPVLEGAVQLAADVDSTCALREDGSVACTGQSPRPLPYLPPVVELAMGAGLVCGITSTADLLCVDLSSGERVLEADHVTDVAATEKHYCYLREGRVWCGGESRHGELGATPDHPCHDHDPRFGCPEGNWVDLPFEAVEVEVGSHITCVRSAGEEVYCWGHLNEPWTPPSRVPELGGPALKLLMGSGSVCVLRPSGQLDCHERYSLSLPRLPESIVSVHLGWGGCLVTADGAVSCWSLGPRPQWLRRVAMAPPDDWSPRPLPVATEMGWAPYPTLTESCTIEHAEHPERFGPFTVEPCGVSTCLRLRTPAGAEASLPSRTPTTDGVVPFLSFTTTHRLYGLTSIETGEVLVLVRSPVDSLRSDADFCNVAALGAGGPQGVVALRSDPLRLRIVHGPLESLSEIDAPTELGPTRLSGAAIAVTSELFTIPAFDGAEIHMGGATRTRPSRAAGLAGSIVFWYAEGQFWAADGLADPVPLFESSADIRRVDVHSGRVAWLVVDGTDRTQVWTAELSSDLQMTNVWSVAVDDAGSRSDIAVNEDQIAYVAADGDLVVHNASDRTERRLAPRHRWGDVWYIADGYVVTGGQAASIARTPIDALPIVGG